jgi:hypothetical protein
MRRTLALTADDRSALVVLQTRSPKPYLRERATALLLVADGHSAAEVARTGLLRPRDPDTICAWLDRFAAAGVAGLQMRPGRGRKPAFFPSAARRRPRHPAHPARGQSPLRRA